MNTDLKDFEKQMQDEIESFLSPSQQKRKENQARKPSTTSSSTKQPAKSMKTGHVVKLAVRTKQLERDTVFEYCSASISKLEAQMEAEKAAKKAGYPIIGYVVEIKHL